MNKKIKIIIKRGFKKIVICLAELWPEHLYCFATLLQDIFMLHDIDLSSYTHVYYIVAISRKNGIIYVVNRHC
jgi:hypothetical protein